MGYLDTAASSRPLTIAQLVVSIIGISLSLLGVIGLSILLLSPATGNIPVEQRDLIRNLLWVLLAVTLLTIPSLVASICSLNGNPSRSTPRKKFLLSSLSLIFFPLLLFLGNRLSSSQADAWLIAPVNILTVLIPIWWFLELGRFRLSAGSMQRQWGLSTFSMFVTLPVSILIEIIVIGVGLVAGMMWLVQQPEYAPFFSQFSGQFNLDTLDWQQLSFDFMPLLQSPEVIAAVILGIALVIPLIEELLKPLGVWVLNKRSLSPAEGFTAGLICGAAFALLESLFSVSAVLGNDWLYTVVGRVGTGLLHVFTAGLNGWALSSAWQDGRQFRTALTYIITVLIHGTWNLFAILMGLDRLGSEFPQILDPSLTGSAVWVLPVLTAGMAVTLFAFNRRLRRAPLPPPLLQENLGGLE